jgi:quercetin dioxygenase-like cupin family protein
MNYSNPILRKAGTQIAQSVRPDDAQYNLKVALYETTDQYEVYVMKWPNGVEIPSHIHHKGIETFYILEGTAEAVVGGNKFSMKSGDLIHTPKYIPHYFEFSENTVLLSIFFDVHYFTKEGTGILYRKYLESEAFEPDAKFMEDKSIQTDSYMHEFVNPVENQNYHYLRRKDEQLASFTDDQSTYNLKVPEWETDGNGEIWEIVWEKGAKVDLHRHNLLYESFYVTSGSIEVDDGQQVYTATVGDCVHLRPFTPHSLICLSDNTKTISIMLNMNPQSQSILQSKIELELLKEKSPELLNDDEYMNTLLVKNDFHLLLPKVPE